MNTKEDIYVFYRKDIFLYIEIHGGGSGVGEIAVVCTPTANFAHC